jgi:GH24 family phage-related lysozyme (muramidase)
MAYSEDNIQQFFTDLLKSSKEKEKAVESLSKTTDKLLEVETKSAKADAKEQKEEVKHKNRLAQLAARKERDQKGPMQEMFGKDKTAGTKLSGWLMAALGIGAGVAGAAWLMSDDPTAKKIRDELGKLIKQGVEALKNAIKEAIDKAVAELDAFLRGWANDQMRGTGLGTTTTPGEQEVQTEAADGTRQEKMDELRDEIKNGNWIDNITGVQQERREQLYYLESGEVMQYTDDFRLGGGGGRYGRSIVSGDVTQIREQTAGIGEEDKARLKELDTMIRDRREYNDRLAKMPKDDDSYDLLVEKLNEKEKEIGQFYDENEALTKMLEGARDKRLERINNPVQRQTGGIINVPGYGDGDKVPMLLPPESFVLNKKASKHFQTRQTGGVPVLKRQTGGFVEAVKHIKKDEALSSLTKGKNDWIRPGGNSVISRKPWSSVKGDTPIHAYYDKVGNVPTIGWGATYYDDISSGTQKVKMGDTITKDKADKVMLDNVKRLAQRYSKMIPNWKKMSNSQRAGLLSMGYNAPNFYGAYRGITAALDSGDMGRVRENLRWGGPSEARITESQAMMRKGPQNLNAIVGPKKVGQKIVGTGNPLVDRFREMTGQSPAVGSVIKRQQGGPITVPGSGDGDKVPMLLPEGSFVLNREASQRLQTGGVVGAETTHQRFMEANESVPTMVIPPPKTVVVKRRALVKAPQASNPNAGYNMGSGSGVNIVEQSSQLHRIQSGAAI